MTIKKINSEIKKLKNRDDISDGYHTFKELYDHRIQLFIFVCKALLRVERECQISPGIWKSKTHYDGTSWDGWFIAGIGTEDGAQISYHLPIEKWDELNVLVRDRAPEWDGHSSDDVLLRLKNTAYLYLDL